MRKTFKNPETNEGFLDLPKRCILQTGESSPKISATCGELIASTSRITGRGRSRNERVNFRPGSLSYLAYRPGREISPREVAGTRAKVRQIASSTIYRVTGRNV